jgi:hypothetical protein
MLHYLGTHTHTLYTHLDEHLVLNHLGVDLRSLFFLIVAHVLSEIPVVKRGVLLCVCEREKESVCECACV